MNVTLDCAPITRRIAEEERRKMLFVFLLHQALALFVTKQTAKLKGILFFLFLVFKAMKLKVTNDYVIFIFLIIVTLWYSYKYILRINRGMEENGREREIERGREYSCNEAMSMAEKRGITIINTYA